jgi:hypothetical protein
MPEPVLRFLVTCPDCALESLSELPIALIANALLIDKAIRLHSICHDRYWTATFAEREHLRQSLAQLDLGTNTHQSQSHTEQSCAVC